WESDRARLTAGDFDGDGRTDVAAFYDYGGANLGIFVFRGTAAGLDPTARRIQLTGAGQWESDRARLTAGDFDGDGRTDVAAFYDYGGANLGIFVFRGTAAGLDPTARRILLTGTGQWDMDRTRLIAGDHDGDGRTDIAAFYDYGGANLGIFVFRGTAAGLDPTARRILLTGAGQWDADRTRFVGGAGLSPVSSTPITPTGPATLAAATSPVAARPLASARVSSVKTSVKGVRLRVSIVSRPGKAYAGRRVQIQRRMGRAYRTVLVTRVRKDGRVIASVTLNRRIRGLKGVRGVRTIVVRVTLPRSGAKPARVGPARSIRLPR
ncbi:MAG: FG-GAP repeat domain-containing protein, partial [Thermoleophilia bacterium]